MAEYELMLEYGLMELARNLGGAGLGTKSWYTGLLYISGSSALERTSQSSQRSSTQKSNTTSSNSPLKSNLYSNNRG